MSKFLNISTDTTLGGNSASDSIVSSQKAIKAYVDSQTGTAPAFANITGQPTDNTNLATALNAKQDTLVSGTNIKTVGGASLLGSGNIALPTKTSDLTNDSGYITGITSSDVTTALGYTPYNSSNPAGYTSNVGTVTSVNNTQPVNGNVTLSIPTVNDATLTITQGGTTKGTFTANASSNVTIDLDSGGSVDVDNSTITLNSSDQIQTVAVKDNRSGNAIKTWTGTRAQYDAIVTKDSNTLYNITDDTDVTLSLLELLFPVGAVYFGTMSVCPLQTLGVGTWQALPADKVIQMAGTRGSVGDTLNESLPNIKGSFVESSDATGHTTSGAFTWTSYGGGWVYGGSGGARTTISLDASRSSLAYQDNAPVQQDAYLLNGWRRIS